MCPLRWITIFLTAPQGDQVKAASAPPAHPAPPDVSIVRLHGEACWWCGAALGDLHAAGTVTTPLQEGGVRQWFIVACDAHQDRRGT